MRTYSVKLDPSSNQIQLTVHLRVQDMPFSVWRDLGRICIMEQDIEGGVLYTLIDLEAAERTLQGARFSKV